MNQKFHIIPGEFWGAGMNHPAYTTERNLVVRVAGLTDSDGKSEPPEIDVACAPAVVALNLAGFPTTFCCSGVVAHHRLPKYGGWICAPYCCIDMFNVSPAEASRLLDILEMAGFRHWEDHLPSFVFRMFPTDTKPRPSDPDIIMRWANLALLLGPLQRKTAPAPQVAAPL